MFCFEATDHIFQPAQTPTASTRLFQEERLTRQIQRSTTVMGEPFYLQAAKNSPV